MNKDNIQARLKECDTLWDALGKGHVMAIAKECGADDIRRRKMPLRPNQTPKPGDFELCGLKSNASGSDYLKV